MAIEFLEQIMSSWFGFTGDYTLIALGILAFFVLGFVLVGLDFKLGLIFCLPLAVVFTTAGWFSTWFSFLFWFIAVGLSLFIIWTHIIDR